MPYMCFASPVLMFLFDGISDEAVCWFVVQFVAQRGIVPIWPDELCFEEPSVRGGEKRLERTAFWVAYLCRAVQYSCFLRTQDLLTDRRMPGRLWLPRRDTIQRLQ